MKLLFVVLSLELLTGCGARSGLPSAVESDAAPASGGAGGTAGAGEGGAPGGGSGGTVAGACSELALVEPVLAVEAELSATYDEMLQLTESSDDGARVTGVFVRIAQETKVVHHASLQPWTSWPADESLGPVHSTTLEAAYGPSAGRAASSRFAIAAPRKEATFVPDLDPDADGPGPGPFVTLTGEVASFVVPRALGVAGSPTHLVGSNDDFAVVGNVVLGDVAKKTPRVGCSLIQPPRAGAVAEGDGWLVASSTGAPVGACGEPGPPPAVPTRIDVWRIAPDAGGTYVTSIDGGDQIVDVQTAPHADGLYVVWSQASLEPGWTIRAARVSGSKNAVVAGPVGVQIPGESSLSFRATAMGDQLAVVRRNDFFGSSPAMHLSVFDEALGLVGSGALETEEVLTGPTTALGSRDGRSLLVGYTSSGKMPWRVRIARFDCSP